MLQSIYIYEIIVAGMKQLLIIILTIFYLNYWAKTIYNVFFIKVYVKVVQKYCWPLVAQDILDSLAPMLNLNSYFILVRTFLPAHTTNYNSIRC